ncbi:MAG: hypothetical protein WC752_03895 [Patescibacteria group bacterium]|jgi:DNA repair exonuclease SbcCD ATPase subunit
MVNEGRVPSPHAEDREGEILDFSDFYEAIGACDLRMNHFLQPLIVMTDDFLEKGPDLTEDDFENFKEAIVDLEEPLDKLRDGLPMLREKISELDQDDEHMTALLELWETMKLVIESMKKIQNTNKMTTEMLRVFIRRYLKKLVDEISEYADTVGRNSAYLAYRDSRPGGLNEVRPK